MLVLLIDLHKQLLFAAGKDPAQSFSDIWSIFRHSGLWAGSIHWWNTLPVADHQNVFCLHTLDNAGIASAWIWWLANKLFMTYVKRLRSYEFSIDWFSAPYSPNLINFSLNLCFFKYTKFCVDWLWLEVNPFSHLALIGLIWTSRRLFVTSSGFPRKICSTWEDTNV